MGEKGWSRQSLEWVGSFLHNRIARVRHKHGTTEPRQLECGLPQGSPLSPLLFLLYIAEVVGSSQWRLGYADDVSILGIGKTQEEAAAAAQKEVDEVMDWAGENAVTFDPTKAEAIYFLGTRAKNRDLPRIRVGLDEIQAANEIR